MVGEKISITHLPLGGELERNRLVTEVTPVS